MKYFFILIFITVFFVFDKSIGYTNTSPLWTHFTFQFQHANSVHLLVNSLAFIAIFRTVEKIINKYILSVTILFTGFIASFMSISETPTVGISAAIYAMTGIYLAMVTAKKFIFKDRNKFYLFVLSIFICLTVSFFKANSNFLLHLFSLIIGYGSGFIITTPNTRVNAEPA
jgi:membrane associated rhomboid family serine protease